MNHIFKGLSQNPSWANMKENWRAQRVFSFKLYNMGNPSILGKIEQL